MSGRSARLTSIACMSVKIAHRLVELGLAVYCIGTVRRFSFGQTHGWRSGWAWCSRKVSRVFCFGRTSTNGRCTRVLARTPAAGHKGLSIMKHECGLEVDIEAAGLSVSVDSSWCWYHASDDSGFISTHEESSDRPCTMMLFKQWPPQPLILRKCLRDLLILYVKRY